MLPAIDASASAAISRPPIAETQPNATASASILDSESVSRNAAADGTMSSVTTRIAPTDSNDDTAVTATATRSIRPRSFGRRPIVCANSGSKVAARSSFQNAATSVPMTTHTIARANGAWATSTPATSIVRNGTKAISP